MTSKMERTLSRIYELTKSWLRGTISMETTIQRITYLIFLYKLNGNNGSQRVSEAEDEEIVESDCFTSVDESKNKH